MSCTHFRFALSLCLLLALAPAASAAETKTLYLSGHGKDDAVQWDFFCDNGQNANKWSTIAVPSNWELQGYGVYTYGRPVLRPWPKVQGQYKHTFTAPADWSGLKVNLVFEGVMTDTQAKVNGQSAGPMHQGGYYQFKYDVTSLLKIGQENLLEVTVDDESANASVNGAERRADYWNYAGIFRPVYLEAVPADSIERVAINAKADGEFAADVFVNSPPQDRTQQTVWSCEGQILDMDGKPAASAISQTFRLSDGNVIVEAKLDNPRLWTAETPNLYQAEFRLKNPAGEVVHSIRKTFGFRTIEIRSGDAPGVFVNGKRIMLKGSDRHSFWPDSGRCLSDQINHDDVVLMKQMNMNAVRMSHYPPDQSFLDECDKQGLYVLDELGGWHAKYDDAVGHPLVEAMVKRDVNHPCILFWDNGNEGGWNVNLDDDFAKWDPQARKVIHPQQTFRGTDNTHYPQYNAVVTKSNGTVPFFPTEMLHANYDGGGGAGLEDYWNVMVKGRAGSGGFLWALVDEDVVRSDKNHIIDSHGNDAPDGIVGPYREKEASYYSVRQLWSPIVITRSAQRGDTLTLENRYSFTDANQCTFTWEWRLFKSPGEAAAGYIVQLKGNATVQGSIPPGATGKLQLEIPEMTKTPPHDALAITAKDPEGREILTWVWSESEVNRYRSIVNNGSAAKVAPAADTADSLIATAGDTSLTFSKTTGLLTAASRSGKSFSLVNGPRLVAAAPAPAPRGRGATAPAAPPAAPLAASTLTSLTQKSDGNDLVISAAFTGPMSSISYRLHPTGWLIVDYAYNLTGAHDYFGVGFDYPEASVKSMRFLGNGPAPVYKNRVSGGTLDVWDRAYNSTITGFPTDDQTKPFDYPEFKGYYSGIRWVQLRTTEGLITALVNQDDLFVQVLKPNYPGGNIVPAALVVPFPATNFSFMHAIPAVGTKANRASTTGPQGQPAVANGEYKGSFSLYFGDLPQP